jgi:hypothetical protein
LINRREEFRKMAVVMNKEELIVRGIPDQIVSVNIRLKNEHPFINWPKKTRLVAKKRLKYINIA